MTPDFNVILPRRGTGSIKFDRRPELDPFWVADMDFASPPEILEALHRRVDHGIFGYAQAQPGLVEAIASYLADRHGLSSLDESHLIHLGGLVPALSLAIRAFCQPSEAVMTCTPVYPPFLSVHRDLPGADLIAVDHVWNNDRWEFNWTAMEAAVTPVTRVFLLCNPQNPLGRVFTSQEILKLAEFCDRHDLVLVSDEIHCDLVLEPEKTPHFSAIHLPEPLANRTITLLAPSKTWNIAGLGYAFALIPDPTLRRKFSAARGHTLSEINALAYVAAEAAYRHGEPWRLALIERLRKNRDLLCDFIRERCNGLSVRPGEATYLAWIDARPLQKGPPAAYFESASGLFLSGGEMFGGPGHIRFNFGCTEARMFEGLEKIRAACG